MTYYTQLWQADRVSVARVSLGLSQLVGSELCMRPEDVATLSMADELIRRGAGKALYKALLKQLGQDATSPREVVTKLLALLELMMEESSGVAAYLMARLYVRAGRQGDPKAQHAVELWLNGVASEDAVETLLLLAEEGVRPAQRLRCLQWADGIRKRAQLVERP